MGTMTGMLDAPLDINQTETSLVEADIVAVPVGRLPRRIVGGTAGQAEAAGLRLRVVDCFRSVRADAKLLERIPRNLMSTAIRYTWRGNILLG